MLQYNISRGDDNDFFILIDESTFQVTERNEIKKTLNWLRNQYLSPT